MKTLKLIALLIFVQIAFIAKAEKQENFKKNLHQEYQLKTNSLAEITNKFGYIHIDNWDKNSIQIDVTILVEAKDQDQANKFFEKISITFDQKDTLVKALTEIKENIKNSNFSINYDIKMPKSLRINLTNSYGDVVINELTGKSNIIVKYGNLKATKLMFGSSKPRSFVVLAYSDGYIQETDWLKLKVEFSKINIEKAEALIVKSEYSKLNFEACKSIVTDSKYDDPYDIEKVQNFVCNGEFSNYTIGELLNSVEVNLKYGNIDIEKISPNFEKIEMDVKYGHAQMEFDKESSFQFNAEADFGEVEFDDKYGFTSNNDKTESTVSGFYGKNKNSKSKVNIIVKFGNAEIN